LIIEQTDDLKAVKDVLTYPGIWETISGDFDDKEAFEVPKDDHIYLLGYNEGQVIGLFVVHKRGNNWFCHVQVKPEYRQEHANEFGTKVLEWVWNNTEINKLRALIPEIYPNVKAFSELMGFSEESVITNSYVKNGLLYDKWLMMIKR